MSSEYNELLGVDNLHYALVAEDDDTAYSAGAVTYLAPAGEIQHEAKVDTNIRYYDNLPMFSTITEGATNVKITVSGVPARLAAILTGKPYDATHGVVIDTGDASNTPDCAFSGRMNLGGDDFRYFQYLKGKFSLGSESAQSRAEKTTEKTYELDYSALATAHKFTMPDGSIKSIKGLKADTTDAAFAGAASWFSQVQTPATLGAVTALTLSSAVPADEATSVAIGSSVVLTFSNKIARENVTIVSASGAVVTTAKTYDATGKILTIKPAVGLANSTVYIVAVAGVTDIYGQTLATSAINFTTAST